jgi:hypothetical protein
MPESGKKLRSGRRIVLDPLSQESGAWDTSFLTQILDDQTGYSQHIYAEAYYHAARTLTRSLRRMRWGALRRDAGIIPILFLWRHHLEISLKGIIVAVSDYQDENCPPIESTHNLVHLWGLARKGLAEFVLDDPELQNVERAVTSFSAFDPDSQAFRYPKLRGGRRAAPGLRHVDPHQLDRAMTRVAKWLDLANYALDAMIDQRDEARRASQWY